MYPSNRKNNLRFSEKQLQLLKMCENNAKNDYILMSSNAFEQFKKGWVQKKLDMRISHELSVNNL